jgi:hypothetical protein
MSCSRIFVLSMFLILCVSTVSRAQDYLITSKGDSVAGDLKIFSMGPEKKVMVNQNKKKTYYTLFQIKNFRFRNENYIPVKGPGGYTFMKVLREGYVSLLAFQLENQVTYDGLYLQKRDGSGMEVPNLSFEKAMKKFLAECNAVVSKLESDVYGRKDLNAIIDDYNNCISGKSAERGREIVQKQEQVRKTSPWDELNNKVKAAPDFAGKADAIEMIQEIKNKISRAEKVPNFMVEGLKSSLLDTGLQADLETALKEIQ